MERTDCDKWEACRVERTPDSRLSFHAKRHRLARSQICAVSSRVKTQLPFPWVETFLTKAMEFAGRLCGQRHRADDSY